MVIAQIQKVGRTGMAKNKYLTPELLDLTTDLENAKRAHASAHTFRSKKPTPVRIKIFGNIVRLQNKATPASRIAISLIVVSQIEATHKKSPIFFAWCPIHGYGAFVPVKTVYAKETKIEMQLLECKRCIVNKTNKHTKKASGTIFERIFKIFKKRGK